MAKPNNRKERIGWFAQKFGNDFAVAFAYKTDREVKKEFELYYSRFRNKDDYVSPERSSPVCLVCNSEPYIVWECLCGENEGYLIKMTLNTKSTSNEKNKDN